MIPNFGATGEPHDRLGDITRWIGSSQEAMKHYRTSYGLWKQLASTEPGNVIFKPGWQIAKAKLES